MIISASRRTDIPAFFSEWFKNRLEEGYCLVPNPMYPSQINRISLAKKDVDAFVFWTKNPEPMFEYLDLLDKQKYLYYFQFTLNNYPKIIEPFVPPIQKRINTFKNLAERLGTNRVIWRYDPIIITKDTDYYYHAKTFKDLAKTLKGSTQRVVISIVDMYQKTSTRMEEISKHNPNLTIDNNALAHPKMPKLIQYIIDTAKANGIEAFTCAEITDFTKFGVPPGSCIDSNLITSLGGYANHKKDLGQRKACLCSISRDIGTNNTCTHGCQYCYSTFNHSQAVKRFSEHNPKSPLLWKSY